ncbi:MAG: hypothetical protein HY698_14870, partial [Deltaproteobacteria bacterium]|nr:hypothetical protein [Deltaproteobacteria bacterium]
MAVSRVLAFGTLMVHVLAYPALARSESDGDSPDESPKPKDDEAVQEGSKEVDRAADEVSKEARKEGQYGGVVPGRPAAATPAPRAAQRQNKGPGNVSWIGFQPQPDGGARVFVQVDRVLAFEQKTEGEALVVTLEGARLRMANHHRPLDTSYFESDLAKVLARAISVEKEAPGKGKRTRKVKLPGVELRV